MHAFDVIYLYIP